MPIPGLNSPQSSWRHDHQPNRPSRRKGWFLKSKTPRPNRHVPWFKFALMVTGVGIAVTSVLSIIVLAWVARDLPNPNRIIDRSVAQSTKIYDRTGKTLLYDVHGSQQRTLVELSDIPQYMKDATLTAEDRQFYQHPGFSWTGILRSFFVDIIHGSLAQGGSTLTQQLVKNAILTQEKTITRKIKELILAYQIEQKFSKDDILKMYFNEIPYGSTAYGVEAAAQTYFGKDVKDIDLAESAALAALPRAPSYYSPYGPNRDKLIARQHFILDQMAEGGFITTEQAKQAKAEQLNFQASRQGITAPHFVMYVREYLTEKYGDVMVEQGGLKVITTLDLYKQKIAEEAVSNGADRNKAWKASNAALVALDPKTGQILSMVGSKDYFDNSIDGQVNVALSPRQPGSSFKPIVYAAAFRKGYTPETVLWDVNTVFKNYDGADYTPKDYDLKERGPVTIRQSLAGSLNIPAVETIYLTGIDNVIDLANDLGYTTLTDRSRYGLSLVLGGAEVKLLEHADAYAALAREGEWHPTTPILAVMDKDGNVLEEYKTKEKKVLATQVARQITSILSDNNARAYIFGAKNFLNLGDRPVAAKTGTTNDYKDAWTMGYTPSLAVGVWVGNNNSTAMKRGADGSVVAAPIWHEFMQRVLGDTPIETFQEPEPTTSNKPVLNGSFVQGITVKIDRVTGQVASSTTPFDQIIEKTYRPLHSILYYINKDDPQGPTPPDPNDPQYQRWEDAVIAWGKSHNIVGEEPPTGYDTQPIVTTQPNIQILAPQANQTFTSRHVFATVSVSSPTTIQRVEYYLNDSLIAAAYSAPYTLDTVVTDPSITSGTYTLKAVAYDTNNSSMSTSVDVALQW